MAVLWDAGSIICVIVIQYSQSLLSIKSTVIAIFGSRTGLSYVKKLKNI